MAGTLDVTLSNVHPLFCNLDFKSNPYVQVVKIPERISLDIDPT